MKTLTNTLLLIITASLFTGCVIKSKPFPAKRVVVKSHPVIKVIR